MEIKMPTNDAFLKACGTDQKVMERGVKFTSLFKHAWYKNQMIKMNKAELNFIFDFLAQYGHLAAEEYYLKARDVFFKEENKARVRKQIQGLVAEVLVILREA